MNNKKKQTKPIVTDLSAISTSLRRVDELPVEYREIFSPHKTFNKVQSAVFDTVLASDTSTVVSAPTGSGKTTLFELAIVRLLEARREESTSNENKIIYLAPVKALCSERYSDWMEKFRPLHLRTAVVTGDSIDPIELTIIQKFDLILTTPEKWDSMTRRWKDHVGLVRLIRLFLIDEVHLLNEDRRGATLEAVVSRMKAVQEALKISGEEYNVRFVAVSATIPNIDDVAVWLGTSDQPAKYFKFDESARPVALKKVVLGYPLRPRDKAYTFDLNLTYKLKQVIISYANGKPTLIFCNSRKSVQQTCTILKKIVTFNFTQEQKSKLEEVAQSITDNNLRGLIMLGLAYHHAGVTYNDRHSIEEIFRSGYLPVLVSTSTLAIGVNLPAHLVIIKSTEQYVCGEWQPYAESQILQMMGRAGRPQFDTSATAVIMTRDSNKVKYETLMSGEELIESSLHNHLIEHLNSEIVLGTITDVANAMSWLKSTFLYVRAMKNPKQYGIPLNLTPREIESKLQGSFKINDFDCLAMTMRELHALEKYELITTSNLAYTIEPTENGKLMARYYIAFETMKIFMKIEGQENIPALLDHLTRCQEFHEVQLRRHERPILNRLNRNKDNPTIRFPLAGKITNKSMKANALIQAVLGALQISDPGLQQESIKVMRIAERLLRGLTLFLSRKNHFRALASAITLQKCTVAKMWENSAPVCRQLPGIGPALGAMLMAAGKRSFSDIINTDSRTLERIINRQPPMGTLLQEAALRIPQYDIDIEIHEQFSTITASVNLLNFEEVQFGNMLHTFTLLISAGDHLLRREVVSDQTLVVNGGSFKVQTYAGRIIEQATDVTVTLISNSIVGVDIQTKVEPASVRGTQAAPASEPLHDNLENRLTKDSRTYFFEKYSFVPSRPTKLARSTKENSPRENRESQAEFDDVSKVDPTQNRIAGNRARKTERLSGNSVRDEDNFSCTRNTRAVKEADREIMELSADDSITPSSPSRAELTTSSRKKYPEKTGVDEMTLSPQKTGQEEETPLNEPSTGTRVLITTIQPKDDSLGFNIDDLLNVTPHELSTNKNYVSPSVLCENTEKLQGNRSERRGCTSKESDVEDSASLKFDVDDLFDSTLSVTLPETYDSDESAPLNRSSDFREGEVFEKVVQEPPIFFKSPESILPLQIPTKSSDERIARASPKMNPSEELAAEGIFNGDSTIERILFSRNQMSSEEPTIYFPDREQMTTRFRDPIIELLAGNPSYAQRSTCDLQNGASLTSFKNVARMTEMDPVSETEGSYSTCFSSQLAIEEPSNPSVNPCEVFKFNDYPKKLRLSYEIPEKTQPKSAVPNSLRRFTNELRPGQLSASAVGIPIAGNVTPSPNLVSQRPGRPREFRSKFDSVFSVDSSALRALSQSHAQDFVDNTSSQAKREEMMQFSQGHTQLPRAVVPKKRRSSSTLEGLVEDSGEDRGSVCTSLSGLLAIHSGYRKFLNRGDLG